MAVKTQVMVFWAVILCSGLQQNTNVSENLAASIFRVKCVWCWELNLDVGKGSRQG
jgi:hypothetical protein